MIVASATMPLRGRSRRRKPSVVCATPGCSEPNGHGRSGKFCETHAAQLAAVSAKLETERGRCASTANGRHKKAGLPRCVNKACGQPRVPPSFFCDECVAEGFTEERDE